jgi:hypothetical protein
MQTIPTQVVRQFGYNHGPSDASCVDHPRRVRISSDRTRWQGGDPYRRASNPRSWCCSLAISRRRSVDSMFSIAVPTPTRGCSSAGALRNGGHPDRADCPICSPQYPNLRRARCRPVPMGLCAVSRWCEGCRYKGKAQLSPALDRISERITNRAFQTLSREEAIRGQPSQTAISLIFQ